MELFIQIIDWLFTISVTFTSVQIYLQINKIWKRKHEKEVAESQSITGSILLIFSCAVSISYYTFVNPDTPSAFETSLYVFQAVVMLLISTGFFVKGGDNLSLWQLAKKAFRMERKEADYLIKKFFKPTNASVIINILHQLAMIDNVLDPKEEELIQAFAKEWNIDYSAANLNTERYDSKEANFVRLRKSVSEYLANEPQKEQAAQLRDMMNALINADDEVSPEEELIANELMGLITNYLQGSNNTAAYDELIVPQRPEHHEFIQSMLPDATQYNISGGIAYSVGTYFSHKYAEMICTQYRDVNLFTIVHAPTSNNNNNNNNNGS